MGDSAEMSLCGKIQECWAHWVPILIVCSSSDIFNPGLIKSYGLITERRGGEGGRETVHQDQQDTGGQQGGIKTAPRNHSKLTVIFLTQEGRISRETAKLPWVQR